MTDNITTVRDVVPPADALARNRAAVNALPAVARRLRFSTSRRSRLYDQVGLRPRLVDRVFRVVTVLIVLFLFIVPNIATIAYYGYIASDQYSSETRFTVRSSMPVDSSDQVGDLTGMPTAKIAQDTQIVTNYLKSRTLLTQLESTADFIPAYTRPDIDWLARLPSDSPIEDRLDYWENMVYSKIDPKSGIVTVDVKAFSPEDAHRILSTVVASSEKLINDMNDRIWTDVTKSARSQVEKASTQLADTRRKYQEERNAAGILTIDDTSKSLSTLLTEVEGEKIALETTYSTNAKVISTDAPHMKVLARQIASKDAQVKELRSQIAGQTSGSKESLADTSSRFAQLDLEQSLAEQQLAASILALEQLRFSSQQQMMYLEGFLAPTLPQSAEYPRRALWIGAVFVCSLLITAAAFGISSVVRRRID